jgi:hypothetical protein
MSSRRPAILLAPPEVFYSKIASRNGFISIGVCLCVLGLIHCRTLDTFISYLIITVAAVIPSVLWFHPHRRDTIPILPVFGAMHYIYYAVPLLRDDAFYGGIATGSLEAAITVSLFLLCATSAWVWLAGARKSEFKFRPTPYSNTVKRIAVGGVILGIIFEIIATSDAINFGSAFGLVRSFILTVASISCYIVGTLRANRLLSGVEWGLSLLGIISLVGFLWSALLLSSGMQFAAAVFLGYIITSRKIPWKTAAVVFALLFILQAGKTETRASYWPDGQIRGVSVEKIPNLFIGWIGNGVTAILYGDVQSDVFDRASLLQLLEHVEGLTPEFIPYFDGGSYKSVISSLTPRFINENKPISQLGLVELNLRYGFLTRDAAESTSIGWGIIAEGYANFGFIGVAISGIFVGSVAAICSRLSKGRSPLAMPTVLSIGILVCLIILEATLSALIVTLWQTVIATIIFVLALRFFSGPAGSLGAARMP